MERRLLSPGLEMLTMSSAVKIAMPTTTQMRVLVLSAVSVVVCAAILGMLQYRSLVQLEIRTRITFQDDLLRSAQAIAGAVEGEVRSIGAAALSSFQTEDSNRDVQDLARRFQELQRQQGSIAAAISPAAYRVQHCSTDSSLRSQAPTGSRRARSATCGSGP